MLPVQGQSQCAPLTSDWCIEFDLTLTDGGFAPYVVGVPELLTTWVSGQGWNADLTPAGWTASITNAPARRNAQIVRTIASVYVTQIEVDFYAEQGVFQGTSASGGDGYYVGINGVNLNLVGYSGELTRSATINNIISGVAIVLQVGLDNIAPKNDPGGVGIIRRVRVRGNGANPFSTPTPSPTPHDIGAPLAAPCALLGSDATFNNFPGRWQVRSGEPFRPTGGGLFMPQSSQIAVQLSLKPNRLYRVTGAFKVAFPEILEGGEYWQIQLGGAAPFRIDYPTNASLQLFDITEARYEPDAQGNYFLILTASDATEAGLVFENICVTEIRGAASSSDGGGRADACQACDAPTSILDIFGIVGWLLCGIRNFFECLFIPFLVGIVRGIQNVLALALSFAYWMVDAVIAGILCWCGLFLLYPSG